MGADADLDGFLRQPDAGRAGRQTTQGGIVEVARLDARKSGSGERRTAPPVARAGYSRVKRDRRHARSALCAEARGDWSRDEVLRARVADAFSRAREIRRPG